MGDTSPKKLKCFFLDMDEAISHVSEVFRLLTLSKLSQTLNQNPLHFSHLYFKNPKKPKQKNHVFSSHCFLHPLCCYFLRN
jgi:hypothetical protein